MPSQQQKPVKIEYVGRELVRVCDPPKPCRLRFDPRESVHTAGMFGAVGVTYAFACFAVWMTTAKPWRQ